MEKLKFVLENMNSEDLSDIKKDKIVNSKEKTEYFGNYLLEKFEKENGAGYLYNAIRINILSNNGNEADLIEKLIENNEMYKLLFLSKALSRFVRHRPINKNYYYYILKYKDYILENKEKILINMHTSDKINSKVELFFKYAKNKNISFTTKERISSGSMKLEDTTVTVSSRLFPYAILYDKLDYRNFLFLSKYLRFLENDVPNYYFTAVNLEVCINMYNDFNNEIAFTIIKAIIENIKKFPNYYTSTKFNDNFGKVLNEKEIQLIISFIENNFDCKYLKDGYKKVLFKFTNLLLEGVI